MFGFLLDLNKTIILIFNPNFSTMMVRVDSDNSVKVISCFVNGNMVVTNILRRENDTEECV